MYGLASAGFSNMNCTSDAARCWGSRSCQSSPLLVVNESTFPLPARGYLSHAWSNHIIFKNAEKTPMCMGEASCFGIDAISGDYGLDCAGVQSCTNINSIYNIKSDITAHGTFSMINSKMYTSGNGDTINFQFYGYYAGYNGSIYCNNDDTCNLYCESNGCTNLNFYCNETLSSCNVVCNNYCPNNWNSSSSNNAYDDYNNDAMDIYNSINENELLLSLNKTYNEFDFYDNCVKGSPYTCEDWGQCEYSNFTDENGTIITNSICCLGRESCNDATINVNNIEANVYCDGTTACGQAKINLNDQSNIYIRARNGMGSTDGYMSNFDKMIVSGSEGIDSSSSPLFEIMNGKYLGCFGERSCQDLIISNVSSIYATGYQSLWASNISSNGNDVNIYLLGYKAGEGLTIFCDSGDICNVYCLNGTNNECLNDITIETLNPTVSPSIAPSIVPSQAPTLNPSQAPSITPTQAPTAIPTAMPLYSPSNAPTIVPSTYPSNAPTAVPSSNPTITPSDSPTNAPTNEYVTYYLVLNVSLLNNNNNNNMTDSITFYVKIEGMYGDTEWSQIVLNQSLLHVGLLNFSLVDVLNVGNKDLIVSALTYEQNSILFNCFSVYLYENGFIYEESICSDNGISITMSNDEYENDYCSYATIDFSKNEIKVKTSDENNNCPYAAAIDGSGDDSETSDSENRYVYFANQFSQSMNITVLTIIGIGVLMVILAKLFETFYAAYSTDAPPIVNIFQFFLHLSDFWSDIGLTLVWFLNGDTVYGVLSGVSLLLSIFVSVYGALQYTGIWKNYPLYTRDCPQRMVNYVKDYERLIFVLSIFAGFKPSILLLASQLMYYSMFNIPLKKDEMGALYKYQATIVIVETVPEFLLQLFYFINKGFTGDSDFSLLVISLVLSGTSITVELMVFIAHRQEQNNKLNQVFAKETLFDFEFDVHNEELGLHHIMTNYKLKQCLDAILTDKNQPWESTVNQCKIECDCYFIGDKLSTNEITVYCQVLIGTSTTYIRQMERDFNDCIRNMFDEKSDNHTRLKQAICNNLKLKFEKTKLNRSQNILLRHPDGKKHNSTSKGGTLRSLSTFQVLARSASHEPTYNIGVLVELQREGTNDHLTDIPE